MPPKKETGKVQPKKETVRINLPPKPSAAPTIKLPTLPPGGPASGSGASPASAAPPLSSAAPAPAAAAPRPAGAAPVTVARAAAPSASAPRPAAAPVVAAPAVSTLDLVLAVVAAIAGLVAIGTTVYMWQILGW